MQLLALGWDNNSQFTQSLVITFEYIQSKGVEPLAIVPFPPALPQRGRKSHKVVDN